MRSPKRRIALLAAAVLAAGAVFGQSDDELFSGGPALVEEPSDTGADLVTANFEKVVGVEFHGSLDLSWTADLEDGGLSLGTPRSSPSFGLSIDARPEEGLRLHARGRFMLTGTDFSGDFRLEELFADLSFGSYGSLRAGKQAANWGLGYWWSPADVLSLQPIDDYDPEAEREGTVALKYHLPVGLGGLSLYAAADGAASADEIAIAGRFEFLFRGSEIGVGGYWRPDGAVAPRLIYTRSFKLGPLDGYSEQVLSFGSERVTADFGGGPASLSDSDSLLFQNALGLSWSDADQEGRWNVSVSAEYYRNGAGVEEGDSYAEHRAELLALVAAGQLSAADLSGYGRHYAALMGRFEDLGATGLGANIDWRGNLMEGSGYYRVAAVYEPVADFRAEAGWKAQYGPDGGEYSVTGRAGYLVGSVELFERAVLSLEWPLFGEGTAPTAIFSLQAEF